jgi:hypothetical protein
MAVRIVNWYGTYCQPLPDGRCDPKAGFSTTGSTNANRFQVSGNPVIAYLGNGNPVYRMLLTSFNSDTAVARIVEMDPRTGAMQVFTPQSPMGVEDTVTQACDSASGAGATLVKANHYTAADPTLHIIYGHLTWMCIYEPEGTHPSFTGLGFVDAYHVSVDNAAFGSTRSAALQNYLTQLASEATANGNAPGQGGQFETVTSTIGVISWDVSGGQKSWYIQLKGDTRHLYVGTVSTDGPALVMAQPGQHVTITFLKVNSSDSVRTMQSFTDQQVPLKSAGS